MEIAAKQRIVIVGAVALSVICGWQIAHNEFVLAAAITGLLALWIVDVVSPVSVDAWLTGVILIGYLVGNRGFAQLHLPSVPLLPAEAALALGGVILVWKTSRTKRLPVKMTPLNVFVLILLVVGLIRLRIDFPNFGLVAVRDFAAIYYASFMFLAQAWAADTVTRRWLERCLTVGFALCPVATLAFGFWPDFFIAHTQIFGNPLILIKTDVAGGLMVAGAIWFFYKQARDGRWVWAIAGFTNIVGVGGSNSRAALAALAAVGCWVVVCREWTLRKRFLWTALMAVMVILAVSVFTGTPWSQTPAFRLYESVASVADFNGGRTYETAALSDKPDNNQFRLVWWQSVAGETWQEAPWLGLGFGYDLTGRFAQIYYADNPEEMAVRSPHNFLLTLFGRMGCLGLGVFIGVLCLVALATWRSGRSTARNGLAGSVYPEWLCCWAIFTTSCFGVVLEGPMGAVAFWTLLGLAAAGKRDEHEERSTNRHDLEAATLPTPSLRA